MINNRNTIQILYVFLFTWFPVGVNDLFSYIVFEKEESRIAAGIAFSLLLTLPAFFLKIRLKLYLLLVYSILLVPSLVFFIHLLLYKSPADSSSCYILYETNPREILEFIYQHISIKTVLLLVLYLFIPFFILKKIKPVELPTKSKLFVSVFFLLFILAALLHLRFEKRLIRYNNYVSDFTFSFFDYKKEKNLLSYYMEQRKLPGNEISVTTGLPDSIPATYIILIGESTSRYHMSLYGYGRKTNPRLEKINNELFVFNSVTAPHAHTILSLRHALTFSNRSDTNAFYTKESMIEIFNRAGFDTYWISNQNPLGVTETQVHALASQCKYKHFERTSMFSMGNVYDEELLPDVEVILKNNKNNKILFVHLMGTHQDFKFRYPESFDVFKDAIGIRSAINPDDDKISIINAYDNANLYNDYIIRSVIEQARRYSPYSFVLYFSDHGDEVYEERDFLGHSESNASKYMLDVPFILWTSSGYRKMNEEQIQYYKQYLDRACCTEDMIHGVLYLAKLKMTYLDETRSVFSTEFFKMKSN